MSTGTLPARQNGSKRGFEAILLENADKIKAVLPTIMSPEKLIRLSVLAYGKNSKLAECSVPSIINSVMDAAKLGLEPNTPLGQCYLIPYKGECTLQIGYRGLITLAFRSGFFVSAESRLVYEGDDFDLYYDPEARLRHKPDLGGPQLKITHAYAYAKLKDGGMPLQIMNRATLDKIRNKSASRNSPAWTDWEGEMYRKAPLKRLLKGLPLSPELSTAIDIDNHGYDEEQESAQRKMGTDGLKERLGITQAQTDPQTEPDDDDMLATDDDDFPEPGSQG